MQLNGKSGEAEICFAIQMGMCTSRLRKFAHNFVAFVLILQTTNTINVADWLHLSIRCHVERVCV